MDASDKCQKRSWDSKQEKKESTQEYFDKLMMVVNKIRMMGQELPTRRIVK